jgi:putative ABC transport system substrate-binding protein
LSLLKQLKPEVKKVLLIYNPTQGRGLEMDKQEVERILDGQQIQLRTIEVCCAGEIYAKLSAFITDADVVLVLKDNTVVSGIDAVVKLCNQHHVTLMCTDLDSSKKGAALSFGVYESEFGIQSALQVIQILDKNERSGNVACSTPKNFKLIINSHVLKNQNLKISKELINLIEKVEVI